MLTSSPIQVPLTESHRNFIRNCGFVLNDRVIVNETQGEIKYIGPVYTKQRVSRGIYVGIQLHQSKGKNDGTFEVC